jgi:hypothetical protein
MIHISVRHDFDRLSRTLDNFSRKQLPFAAARALTTIAREAGNDVTRGLSEDLDRPTPFTKKAVAVLPARKTDLRAVVLIKDRQAQYLGYQIRGGQREPKGKALVLPAGIRLNQFGNIPRHGLARAKANKDTFVGVVKGVGGFWQRTKGGGLKLLAAFIPQATYKPILGFEARVERVVRAEFPRRLRFALVEALKTARR